MLIAALALTFGLTACTKPEEQPTPTGAYKTSQSVFSFVSTTEFSGHTGLGFVNIKTDSNGDISTVILDEIFFPYEWARLTKTADTPAGSKGIADEEVTALGGEGNIVTNRDDGTILSFPKYLYFSGTMYTAFRVATGTDTKQTDAGAVRYFAGSSTASLETTLGTNPTLARAYYDVMSANNFSGEFTDVTKMSFAKAATAGASNANLVPIVNTATLTAGKIRIATSTATANAKLSKSKAGYTPGKAVQDGTLSSGRVAWSIVATNIINAIQDFGLENLTTANIAAMDMVTEADNPLKDKGYVIGTGTNAVSTGASVANMKAYVTLIKNAYDQIKK